MRIIGECLALAAYFFAAATLTRRCLWGGSGVPDRALRLVVTFGVGVGLAAVGATLLVRLQGVPAPVWLRLLEATLLISAGLLVRWRSAVAPSPPPQQLPAPAPLRWAFAAAVLSALVAAAGAFLVRPFGRHDAWSMWSYRGKLLAEADATWEQIMVGLAHTPNADYPLLLPATIARVSGCLGGYTQLAPALVSVVFTLATLMLLTAVLAKLRGGQVALTVGLCALGAREFLKHGYSHLADMPFAFFLLLANAVILLGCWDEGGNGPDAAACRNKLALAGTTLGLAAWTKNEGLVPLLFLPAAMTLWAWRRWEVPKAARALLWVGVPAALLLVGVLWMKNAIGVENRIFGGGRGEAIRALLLDPGVHAEVWRQGLRRFLKFGSGMLLWLPVVVFATRHLTRGGARVRLPGILVVVAAGVVIQVAAYYLVYVVDPNGVDRQMGTTFSRLALQLFPTCLLCLGVLLPARLWRSHWDTSD